MFFLPNFRNPDSALFRVFISFLQGFSISLHFRCSLDIDSEILIINPYYNLRKDIQNMNTG